MEARGGRSANALWFLQCERKLPFLAVSGFSKPGPLPPGRPTWKQVGDARVSSQEQPVLNEAWFKKSDSSLSALPAFLPVPGPEHLKLTCQKQIRLDQRWQAMLQAFRSLSSASAQPCSPVKNQKQLIIGSSEEGQRTRRGGSPEGVPVLHFLPLPAFPPTLPVVLRLLYQIARALPASSRLSRTGM